MPIQSKPTLKSYFQTGDRPTESNFVDFIDSLCDDTVYGSGWNGITDTAPSKNAVYNKIETLNTSLGSYVLKAGDTLTGNLLFASAYGIDSASSGTLNIGVVNTAILNMGTGSGNTNINIGTSGTNTIQIGNSNSTVNILGNTVYENVANLQISDKLFMVNKGGASSSGSGAGFEIEEGGTVTGYLKTTGGRDGFLFHAPANAADSSFIFSATSGRSYTFPDTTGTVVLTANKLSVFAATSSSELASVISDETGSGALVFATSPTLVTPVLGVASATSLSILDTTYKIALDSNSVGNLRIGNGFATMTSALPFNISNSFQCTSLTSNTHIASANNTFDLGQSNVSWANLWVRNIKPEDMTTSNTVGWNLALLAGIGNGTGVQATSVASTIIFKTPSTASSGVTQTIATRMQVGANPGAPTSATQMAIWYGSAAISSANWNVVFDGGSLYHQVPTGNSFAWRTQASGSNILTLNATSLITGVSASAVYRLTNGGSNVTAQIMLDPAGTVSSAGALGYAFDTSNGLSFTHANGTLRVRGWSAILANLGNTAGSEYSDLQWTPQNSTDTFILNGGNLRLTNLSGSTNRFVTVDVNGNFQAVHDVIAAQLTNTTIQGYLANASNWTNNTYSGTALTGTYQTQWYNDSNYWYFLTGDNAPVRIALGSPLYWLSKSASYTITTSDLKMGGITAIGTNTGSAVAYTLPLAANCAAGTTIEVTDTTGNAATNNITFVASGSDNIRGTSAVSANYGSRRLRSDGVSQWIVL